MIDFADGPTWSSDRVALSEVADVTGRTFLWVIYAIDHLGVSVDWVKRSSHARKSRFDPGLSMVSADDAERILEESERTGALCWTAMPGDPGPEELAARCAAVQSGWSEVERAFRAKGQTMIGNARNARDAEEEGAEPWED